MTRRPMRIGRVGFAAGYAGIAALLAVALAAPLAGSLRGAIGLVLLLCAALLVIWRCNDLGKPALATFWRDQIPVVGPLVGFGELLFKPGAKSHDPAQGV